MQFSLRLVGLLACFLLLLSPSAFSIRTEFNGQTTIDGLQLTTGGFFYAQDDGDVNSGANTTNAPVYVINPPFNADNSPSIRLEEAYLKFNTTNPLFQHYSIKYCSVNVFIMVTYYENEEFENTYQWEWLGIIRNCAQGDGVDIAMYCSYDGEPVGKTFSSYEWNNIRQIRLKIDSIHATIEGPELDLNAQLNFTCACWLKCNVIPHIDVTVPEYPEAPNDYTRILKDILKEEKTGNNQVINTNQTLSDIDSKLDSIVRKDFTVSVDPIEVDTTDVERKLDDIDTSIDGLSSDLENSTLDITGAINGIGDSITGAIDGLADSIGDGINIDVGDVSVETDISWFQEGEGDTDLGEFETDDVVSRSDYNSLFDPIGRSTGALYLADRTSTFWNELGNSSGGTLTLATLPENMGGASINLPTWNDIGNLTGGENSSGFFSSLPAFIGACIGLIVCLSLFVWIYNLLSK